MFLKISLCQSFFLNKVAVLRPPNLLTKKLWQSCFPVCFAIYLGNVFYRTPLVTASVGSCSSTHKCEVWKGIFLSIDHWIVPNVSSKIFRSSRPDVFLRKGVLKICIKFTGEHPCRSANSIKLQSNYPCQSDWNRTLAWVFFCKFAAYFQNTFS